MWLLAVSGVIGACLWWLDWSSKRETARALANLAAMPCQRCGKPYGSDAAHAARERYFAHYRVLAAANPNVRFRMNGVWPVECSGCGAKAHYDSTAYHLQRPS